MWEELLVRPSAGITVAAIADIEARIGRPVPGDLAALWREVGGGRFRDGRFADLDGEVRTVQELLRVVPFAPIETEPPYYSYVAAYVHDFTRFLPASLVPFAVSPTGDYYCVDPGDGRVRVFLTDTAGSPIRLVCRSMNDLCVALHDRVEVG